MSMGAAIFFFIIEVYFSIHGAKLFYPEVFTFLFTGQSYFTQRCLPIMSANIGGGGVSFSLSYSALGLEKYWVFRAEISIPTLRRGPREGEAAVGFTKNDFTTLTQRFII